jgi:hypothetical protein
VFQIEPIVFILKSVLSNDPLTTRFIRLWRDYTGKKKHYPWSDLTNKNTQLPEITSA